MIKILHNEQNIRTSTDISPFRNNISFISSQYSTHQLAEHIPKLGIRGVATAAVQLGCVYLHAQTLVDIEILQKCGGDRKSIILCNDNRGLLHGGGYPNPYCC